MNVKKSNVMRILKYGFLLAAIGAITGFYLYNKPVKSTSAKNSDLVVQSQDLFAAYERNEIDANRKYLNKVVSVVGNISSMTKEDNNDIITLETGTGMFGIVCKMEQGEMAKQQLKAGDSVKLKGVCTGMLMDAVLIRCVFE